MTLAYSPYSFDSAIVRAPAKSVVNGLRDGDSPNPDFKRVCDEHASYIKALQAAGVTVHELPPLDAYPDSIFVEDPALVFPQGAIELRPGAPSRQGEVAELSATLHDHFEQVLSLNVGYADGGDMLLTSQGLMIGLSNRTDRMGADRLQKLLGTLDIPSRLVNTPQGVLHFKSDCSLLDDDHIISTQRLASSGVFDDFKVVAVPEGEEAAANALRINDQVFVGHDYPRTLDLLDRLGYQVVALPVTEIAKIDAGLSCMSLRWKKA